MPASAARITHRVLAGQLGLVAVAIALLNLWPPARGPVLLVPLTPGARLSAARLAVDGGALLLAGGPVPGSLVVYADRPRFAAGMLAAGVLPIAATAGGCGPVRERRA